MEIVNTHWLQSQGAKRAIFFQLDLCPKSYKMSTDSLIKTKAARGVFSLNICLCVHVSVSGHGGSGVYLQHPMKTGAHHCYRVLINLHLHTSTNDKVVTSKLWVQRGIVIQCLYNLNLNFNQVIEWSNIIAERSFLGFE